jgi:biopolymer transport protein ExbD
LSASQRARLRKRADSVAAAGGDETGGELNVVPFLDILLNVLMFVLATSLVTFTSTIDSKPPEAPHRPKAEAPPLSLNVIVMREGFVVSARGRRVGPGCTEEGAGMTVGSRGGDYDYAGLTACARRLKDVAGLPEAQVVLAANPDVPYQTMIHTMDALRQSDGKDLFPDVRFAVPR